MRRQSQPGQGGLHVQAPYYPILYVRGYAMTPGERDEAAADPFCGFNLGSTTERAGIDRNAPPRKFVFESPLLRLVADFGYGDVYEDGHDILDPDWQPRGGNAGIPARSVVIHRYYDSGSTLLGDGRPRDLTDYARELDALVLRVRELVCAHEGIAPSAFRCYLVAHSMGGLIVRAFLQNPACGSDAARAAIDKVFTYATPHNGIELAGLNVPSFLTWQRIDTFNRGEMARALDLQDVLARWQRVDFLRAGQFPLDRVFCMIGTNRSDYGVASGAARTFAGHGSDGLVKIENAGLWGLDAHNEVTGTAATAFAYRSHSGPFGIVNSEEAFQNLWRFLFGDVRVDIWLEVDSVALPAPLEGQDVDGLYQFELLARPRGKRWFLSRRTAEEDSPACRTHKQLTGPGSASARRVYLSTVFLANRARVSANPGDRTLGYSLDLRVRAPSYEVNRRFWPDQHYEGSALFQDQLVIEMAPPEAEGQDWTVRCVWASEGLGAPRRALTYQVIAHQNLRIEIPLPAPDSRPGIQGRALLIASPWNPPPDD
jgi:hypothetical protein